MEDMQHPEDTRDVEGTAEARANGVRLASVAEGVRPFAFDRSYSAPFRPSVENDLKEIVQGAASGRLSDPAFLRAREILEEAYESATELRLAALARIREQEAQTERQANAIVTRAHGDAERTASQAAMEAQLALQRAQRTADETVARARTEAEQIVDEGRVRAEEIIDEARKQAGEVYDAAAQSLVAARERQNEMQRAEQEFEAAAATLLKWLGLPEEGAAGSWKNVLKRK